MIFDKINFFKVIQMFKKLIVALIAIIMTSSAYAQSESSAAAGAGALELALLQVQELLLVFL